MPQAGDNSDKLLKSHAHVLSSLMEQVKEIKADIKLELKAAKDAGLDVKALVKIVREMGMDEDQRSKQLEFDLVVGDYRKRVGITAAVEREEAA